MSSATAPRSIRGRPRAPTRSGAPRRDSSIVERRRRDRPAPAGSRRRRGPRRRRPPKPTMTAGPNCGSRVMPTMSSTPGSAIGSTSSPRAASPRAAASSSEVARRSPDRRRTHEAEPEATDIGLVGQPDRVELERDRDAEAGGDHDRLVRVPAVRVSTTAEPGRAQEVEALALGKGPPGPRRVLAAHPGSSPASTASPGGAAAGSCPRNVRSVARPDQVGRAGPDRSRSDRRRSHQARRAIASSASRAPRRSGTPPASSSSAWISGVASPLVSEMKTGSRSGRSRVASRSAPPTVRATSTSEGSDRNGKSWTIASTS